MLELTVQDFGPIKSGTITLRPLTLLIGPNNVGKSYLALLAYALTGTFTRPGIDVPELPRLLWRIGRRVPGITWPEDLEASLTELAKRTPHVRYEDFDDRTRDTLKKAIDRFVHSAASALSRELKRCFASEISELPRRTDGGTFRLSLHQAQPPVDLRLSVAGRDIEVSLTGWDLSGQEFDFREPRGLPSEAAAAVYGSALGRLFPFLFSSAYYFPAARSGILQAHRLLASALVAQASLVGIERIEVPKLSGVVADFIGNLLRLERRRRPPPAVAAVAEFVECEVCKGRVDLRPGEGAFEYPEIYYRYHDYEFPLHRTSSMVSELAPIILFLKYVVNKHDFLVIEEPEAHLHPDNQRILARAMVRLIRQGVRVLITTHSDYLLEQISNFVRLARRPEVRNERGYGEDEYLSAQDVGVYLLRFEDDGGSVVHELSVTEEEGIPAEEFVRIAEELYDETAALDRVTAER